jgi:hypothetical protein
MEKNILKISIIFATVIKYLLYFCSAMMCIGIFLIIAFKDRVMSMLELEDIGRVVDKATAFPFVVWTCFNTLAILICIIVSVTKFQKILMNFQKKEYFSNNNSKYSIEILIAIIILTICQILAQISFNYMHVTDVSVIYDLSVKDYLFNIVLVVIAFISTILFKNGKILKDDSESII